MKVTFVDSIIPYIKNTAAKEVGAGMRYTIHDVKTGESLFTTAVNTCSGFVLNSGHKNLMGHIQPEGFNTRNFASAFENIVNDFKSKYGEIKAFIFGGRESSFVDPYCSTASNEVYATMYDVLSTKCKIPDKNIASVLGKFKHVKTNDDVAVIGDRVYIANKPLAKNMPDAIYEDIEIPDSFLV